MENHAKVILHISRSSCFFKAIFQNMIGDHGSFACFLAGDKLRLCGQYSQSIGMPCYGS